MIRQLWPFDHYDSYEDFDYEIDDLACLKNFIGSPPPPYTTEDLRRNEERKGNQQKERKISYNDVGEEICVKILKRPKEELGLTILGGEAFEPHWPTVLDIQSNSPAGRSLQPILIGDQIKEIDGIPTETLAHSQVLALFSKASDEINIKIRRGLQPSDRSFKWYKHPFSSVSRKFDEISVKQEKSKLTCECDDENKREPNFSSFKANDSYESKQSEYAKPVFGIRHARSLSASAASKRSFFAQTPKQRRRTVDETRHMEQYKNFGMILPSSKHKQGKYISDEIDKLSLDSHSFSSNYESQNSLNSTLSTSTISSISSTSTTNTHDEGHHLNHPSWMDNMINTSMDQSRINSNFDDVSFSQSTSKLEKARTPVNIIRNSFRRKKIQKEIKDVDIEQEARTLENSKSPDSSLDSTDNTLLLTVWVADRKRLGLKFAGGSVNPYGDSNIFVQEIKKTGTDNKLFREGDEVLEIDRISMNGLDVREVHRIIGKLEGNYVEFKIFRPKH